MRGDFALDHPLGERPVVEPRQSRAARGQLLLDNRPPHLGTGRHARCRERIDQRRLARSGAAGDDMEAIGRRQMAVLFITLKRRDYSSEVDEVDGSARLARPCGLVASKKWWQERNAGIAEAWQGFSYIPRGQRTAMAASAPNLSRSHRSLVQSNCKIARK